MYMRYQLHHFFLQIDVRICNTLEVYLHTQLIDLVLFPLIGCHNQATQICFTFTSTRLIAEDMPLPCYPLLHSYSATKDQVLRGSWTDVTIFNLR